jgi:hypothetical protein
LQPREPVARAATDARRCDSPRARPAAPKAAGKEGMFLRDT